MDACHGCVLWMRVGRSANIWSRKKQEQASKRDAIKEDRRQGRAPDEGDARAGMAT